MTCQSFVKYNIGMDTEMVMHVITNICMDTIVSMGMRMSMSTTMNLGASRGGRALS